MFAKLIGNDQVKEILQRFIANERVPNSLILAGPEGVGKRQFALAIAMALVCTDRIIGEACEICPACRRVGVFAFPKPDDKDGHALVISSEHPDVGTIIPYKQFILVDAIRHLEKEANFRPFEASSRIFIIDNADRMNDAAANALLKTLEEPPATTHIFLITSRPDSMLATIRSRCQMVRFSPIETKLIERFLIDEQEFSSGDARIASAISHGSIGRAISVKIEEYKKQCERMLNTIHNALVSVDIAAILRTSEELNDAKNKDKLEQNLDLLASLTHDIWSLNLTGDESRIVNAEHAGSIVDLAANVGSVDLASWVDEIGTMRQNFNVNINRKVAVDALFVGMATR